MSRIIESPILVQARNGVHFSLAQIEIEQGKVFDETLFLDSFGDDCGAALDSPSEDNLSGGLVVASSYVFHRLQVNDRVVFGGHGKLNVGC